MRTWFLKTFKADKLVKVVVAFEDGRTKTFYEIPNEDGTVILSPTLAVLLKEDCRMISGKKNYPTYYFTYKSAGAYQLINLNKPDKKIDIPYDAKDFSTAIDNKIAEQVFKASNTGMFYKDTFMILAIVVLCFLIFGYYMNMQLESIIDIIPVDPEPTGELIG